ncbi:ceramide phosphoethanolamine synthase-like [Argonauta hians]
MTNIPTNLITYKHVFYLTLFIMSVYFLVMDIILYVTLQNTVLCQKNDGMYSPFRPLTVKLITTDPLDHWIVSPLMEYFDEFTGFSGVFYFITPNMISFFHMFLTIIAGKLVSSPSLHTRRIAVLVFQMHDLLDALDGIVFRARAGKVHLFQSHRSTVGYVIDGFCDTIGGTALCVGLAVYLCRNPPSKRQQNALPWTKADLLLDSPNGVVSMPDKPNGHVSKFTAFFRCFSFGMQLLLAAGMWDKSVARLSAILQHPLKERTAVALQVDMLHSTSTAVIFWLWRYLSAMALLQMILFAIFIDKVWEFLSFIMYIGWPILIAVIFATELHIKSLREKMHM